MPIDWSPWQPDAFARARAESKPVLLSIAAVWCAACREMDRTSYAEPAVERLIAERFVPVRVDADRRPDIAERYALDGLPTTAFLTPDGDLVGGGTFVAADRFARVLERAAEAFGTRREEIARRRQSTAVRVADAAAAPASDDALIEAAFASFDPTHGGFGLAPKFPLTAPLHLALYLYRTTNAVDARRIVETTLDAMCTGDICDRVDGGFFRVAGSRDWRQPHYEKLLDVNAAMLLVLTEAAEALEAARFAEIADGLRGYLGDVLADREEGGWYGSQAACSDYYEAPAPARRTLPPPPVDPTLYSDWNGAMISAALRAADARRDATLAAFAVRSLERIFATSYRPGQGVAHYYDGQPRLRGLLADQIAMAAASLDAAEATGRVAFAMMAEELALYVLRTMWDDREGGLFDRTREARDGDLGLLREPVKPFVANCQAARLFTRLADSSGKEEYSARARQILASLAPRAAAEGPLAAHYLLAMREVALR